MTIDQLIRRLKDIRSAYGGNILVCKTGPAEGNSYTILKLIEEAEVYDAESVSPKAPEVVSIFMIDKKDGVPFPVKKGLFRVLFLN